MYTLEQIKEAGLNVFANFVTELWLHLDLKDTRGNPSPPTPVQKDIANYLQYGPRRSIIEAFRGVGKSWITAAFTVWLLFLDPQNKILVVSASQERADAFSTFVKQLIETIEWLSFLAPRPGQRHSNLAFDVGPATPDQSPSVKSAGITGQITGSRANLIIADDVEIPKNSYTHLLRERLAEQVKEFDAILKPGGRVVYLGTPQVEQSLYNRLPQRGYEMQVWPAEIPKNASRYAGRLAPYILQLMESGQRPGTPVDPQRFNEDDLAERRASYGHSGYNLQFMLDTNPSDIDRHPLKVRDLMVDTLDMQRAFVNSMWTNSKTNLINDLDSIGFDGDFYYTPWREEGTPTAEYTQTVMAIDPSGAGADETAYAIVKLLYSQLFLVDVGGFKDGFGEATLKALAAKAAHYDVNDLIVERNYGGGMFSNLLMPVLRKVSSARLDPENEVWHTGQKEIRILDTLEPLIKSHRLTIDRRVIEEDLQQFHEEPKYSFIYQMTRLTRDKGSLPHEDRLEAVQLACSFFADRLKADKDKLLKRRHDNLMLQEVKSFIDAARKTRGQSITTHRHIRRGRR